MVIRLPTAVRNAALAAVVDLVDAGPAAGRLRIYSGPQPLSANNAPSGTLLAEVTLSDPAYGPESGGSAALVDPPAVEASADGTAGWFRIVDSTGATVMDGSVTATGGGGDLTLATTSLTVGLLVDITGGSVTMPSGE